MSKWPHHLPVRKPDDSLTREWNTSELEVQHSLAGNVMGLAVGGIVALIFSNYFGNLPVLLAFHSFAFGTGAWCAAATSLNSFLIARILNGIFSSVGIAVSELAVPF